MVDKLQKLFDECVSKMIKQGKPCGGVESIDGGIPTYYCKYKGDGVNCAAGLLMTPEALAVVKEGLTIGEERNERAVEIMGWDHHQLTLVSRLQNAHDDGGSMYGEHNQEKFIPFFLERCKVIAKDYELNTKVLEGVQ